MNSSPYYLYWLSGQWFKKKYCKLHAIVSLEIMMVQPVPREAGARGSLCLVLLTRAEQTQRQHPMAPSEKAAGETGHRTDIQKRKAKDSNAIPGWNIAGKTFQIFAGDLGFWILITDYRNCIFVFFLVTLF